MPGVLQCRIKPTTKQRCGGAGFNTCSHANAPTCSSAAGSSDHDARRLQCASRSSYLRAPQDNAVATRYLRAPQDNAAATRYLRAPQDNAVATRRGDAA
jgi:hypothetical protein